MSISLKSSPFISTEFHCKHAHDDGDCVSCLLNESNCKELCTGSEYCPFFCPRTGITNNLNKSNAGLKIYPGIYQHFKGKYYQVLCISEHTETAEKMVIYQALYEPYKIYCRPLSMFEEDIDDIDLNYRGPRFIRQNFEE